MNHEPFSVSRRRFVRASAAVAAAGLMPAITRGAHAAGSDAIRIGVIGCGGRGTGAGANALQASPATRIVALADLFPERIKACRENLRAAEELSDGQKARLDVTDARCHAGFDSYRALLAEDVDSVILATPPHFRPIHLAEAVARGKHVFMEKPVAVDPAGIRSVLASAELADAGKLGIVAGTQRRHEASYLEAMKRIKDGAIGRVLSGRVSWNQGGLWMKPRQAGWSDMEWQLRNWLYFTWLSGDHICEQHVHNIDVANWVMGGHPIRAVGMGGRQVRTDPAYGHVFDHFAVEYEYPDSTFVTSMCRQIDGCDTRVEERFTGTEGACRLSSGEAMLTGRTTWRASKDQPNPYVQEHVDLYESILAGTPLNEAGRIAESTLTAIMGRMSAYTGQAVTWEQALNSKLDLSPPAYEFGPLPATEVAVPGKTPLT